MSRQTVPCRHRARRGRGRGVVTTGPAARREPEPAAILPRERDSLRRDHARGVRPRPRSVPVVVRVLPWADGGGRQRRAKPDFLPGDPPGREGRGHHAADSNGTSGEGDARGAADARAGRGHRRVPESANRGSGPDERSSPVTRLRFEEAPDRQRGSRQGVLQRRGAVRHVSLGDGRPQRRREQVSADRIAGAVHVSDGRARKKRR